MGKDQVNIDNKTSTWKSDQDQSKSNSTKLRRQDLYEIFHVAKRGSFSFFPPQPTHTRTSDLKISANFSKTFDQELPFCPINVDLTQLDHLICYITIPITIGAHPEWKSKRILWADGAAEKIINDFNIDKKNLNKPIPVFQMVHNNFKFIGWWSIKSIKIVEPFSQELRSMINMKEKLGAYVEGRRMENWQRSLSTGWAKVEFIQVKDTCLSNITDFRNGQGGEYVKEIGHLKEV
ncbi:uncharacterized protein L201_002611 [Kwoniella dendrophila CBS 6074]|uniref:Uncharacterized protein n=1 Tax=Kwoniella dendrophila CBS 6074 TaxID=1295534 RepID=A0AAX4JQR8_9TREE